MTLKEIVDTALECHRSGNLHEARLKYEEALKLSPRTADLWYLLGKISLQENNNEEAIRLISRAVELNGSNAYYYANLSVALQNLGRNGEAITAGQNAIALDPDNVVALNAVGNAYAEAGDYSSAASLFLRAIRINPTEPEIRINLGNLYAVEGKHREAAAVYKEALALSPNQAEVLRKLGKELQACDDIEEAVDAFLSAQKLDPSSPYGYNLLGNALTAQKNYDAAGECFLQALAVDRNYSPAYCGLGKVMLAKELFDEAVSSYETAIELNPHNTEAFVGLGNVMRESGRFDAALAAYKHALELKPDFAEVYYNISNVYFDKGEMDAAEENCRKALSIDPQQPEAHWNMAWAFLARGDFRQGWKLYEWRLKKKGTPVRIFTYPQWDGSPVTGKNILILSEQGVGDEVMFASCLSEVIGQAAICLVECDKRLVPLFDRSFPGARFIERFDADKLNEISLPPIDFRIEIGSLPPLLRPGIEHFPKRRSYLKADEEKIKLWKERFLALGEGLNIGISWKGGIGFTKRLRSVPLDLWESIFALSGCHFISLQYGQCSDELHEVREKFGITVYDWDDADPLKDLDDFAAQVSALDLVISIDNSTVHMAGALGVPAWVLLPKSADWRWMRDIEDTPWYQSLYLFRQTDFGDWEEVMRRVSDALLHFIQEETKPEIRHSYEEAIAVTASERENSLSERKNRLHEEK